MISKHSGNLNDSKMFLEFEKTSIKKGLAKPAEIVKTAAPKYEASNDLNSDLITLANGLRAQGFEKEANSLEDKIYNVKLAETHLYHAIDEDGQDLLDFAHPDGDLKITDSPHGMVETTDSAHKKIVDIVNKKPTGKYSAAQNVVIAAAEVLDINFLKKAQEQINLNELTEEPKNALNSEELKLQQNEEDEAKLTLELTEEQLAKRAVVNDEIKNKKLEIIAVLDQALFSDEYIAKNFTTDDHKIMAGQGSKAFLFVNKIGAEELEFIKKIHKDFFGLEYESAGWSKDIIKNFISSNERYSLYEALRPFVPEGIRKKYFWGTVIDFYTSTQI